MICFCMELTAGVKTHCRKSMRLIVEFGYSSARICYSGKNISLHVFFADIAVGVRGNSRICHVECIRSRISFYFNFRNWHGVILAVVISPPIHTVSMTELHIIVGERILAIARYVNRCQPPSDVVGKQLAIQLYIFNHPVRTVGNSHPLQYAWTVLIIEVYGSVRKPDF